PRPVLLAAAPLSLDGRGRPGEGEPELMAANYDSKSSAKEQKHAALRSRPLSCPPTKAFGGRLCGHPLPQGERRKLEPRYQRATGRDGSPIHPLHEPAYT